MHVCVHKYINMHIYNMQVRCRLMQSHAWLLARAAARDVLVCEVVVRELHVVVRRDMVDMLACAGALHQSETHTAWVGLRHMCDLIAHLLLAGAQTGVHVVGMFVSVALFVGKVSFVGCCWGCGVCVMVHIVCVMLSHHCLQLRTDSLARLDISVSYVRFWVGRCLL